MIKFIDLFAGTGGIRLGFEQAMKELSIPFKCVKSAEIDKFSCETYQQNFKENPYCDVTTLNDIEPFDVLLAGFPCQAFSSAGKQLGFNDTRGTLFFDVARLVAKYQPKLCLLENVRGLLNHDKGRTFHVIKNTLNELGYNVEYRLLNASNYGVPQNRLRIYIIATNNIKPIITLNNDVGAVDSHSFKKHIKEKTLFDTYSHKLVKDILEKNPSSKYNCSPFFVCKLKKALNGNLNKINGLRLIDSRNGNSLHSWELGLRGECSQNEVNFMNLLIANRRKKIFGTHQDGKALSIDQIKTFYHENDINIVIKNLIEKKYLKVTDGLYNLVAGNMSFEVFKFLDPYSVSITLTASDSNRLGIYHNDRIRRITPRECARLQGYPENYILNKNDTLAYKQLGNAVCVPVIKELIINFMINNKNYFH